mgnify:CR=1 FL=1
MEQNAHIIRYTNNKHGYTRILQWWVVELRIPKTQKHNKKFIDKMMAQAEKLFSKTKKRKKILAMSDIGSIVRGHQNNSFFSQPALHQIFASYVEPKVCYYAQYLNQSVYQVVYRQYRRQRGRCTSDNRLAFNTQLVHLPQRFTDYVIAHECAHLIHKHHQPRFRQLVSELYPSYKIVHKEMRLYLTE